MGVTQRESTWAGREQQIPAGQSRESLQRPRCGEEEGNRPEQVTEQHAKGSLWQHMSAEQGIGSLIQERLPALKLLTLDSCVLVYYRNFVIHLTCKLHL